MLVTASSLALVLVSVAARDARADEECGSGTTVVCSPGGNPYANGIRYRTDGALDLSFDSGVAVDTPAAGITTWLQNSAPAVTIDTTAGSISTNGLWSDGIFAGARYDANPTVDITTGNISTAGYGSNGVLVFNASTVSIDTTAGSLSTQGDSSSGIDVFAPGSSAAGSIGIKTGPVTTAGAQSAGLHIGGAGAPVVIDTTAGPIETRGDSSAGILSRNLEGSMTVTAGRIATSGNAAFGIAATNEPDWNGSGRSYSNDFILTAPITATGSNAGGVAVRDVGAGGPVTVTAQADVTASGQNSVGIAAASLNAPVHVTVNSGVAVSGGWSQSPADLATGASRAGVNLAYPGRTSTDSATSYSWSTYVGGGLPAAGVVLFSGSSAGARLTNDGTIGALNDRAVTMGFPCGGGGGSGGSGNGSGGNGATEPREDGGSGGVLFNMTPTAPGGKSWLGTFASAVMGAIMPSAHAAAPPASRGCDDWDAANSLPATQSVTIDNNNLMTGYVTLWDGAAHTFNNAGTFELRHFADTNGDGVRDTKAVSVSDFGGPNSTFNNSGTVRFAPVAGAPATDAAGYYVPTTGTDSRPLEAGFYDLAREGVVQGQFVNLQTFNNSGVIDLRGPEIGNTLVMTSNPVAGGAPGTGTFVTNGGQLLVNARLNDGIAPGGATNSYSDMLIVDRTRMGSGPTAIGVSYDPASAGALTTGNGIEIVEVRDKANSATGVFVLGNRVAGGAYEYTLHHHGVGPDGADGNWYLRSTRIVEPETPGPGPAPDPGQTPDPVVPARPIERPNYRVEVPVDAIVPALASRLGMTMIGTLDDRYGPDFAPLSEQPPAPAPAREIWCKDASRNFRCTPTPQQNAYYAGVDQQAPLPAGHLFWARVFGQFGAHNGGGRTDADRLNAFERNGSSYGYRMGGIQFGAHLYRDQLNTLGLYVGYGRIGATVDTVYGEGRAGSVAMDAYSLGGYWTHRRPSGWYVDTVLQGTHYGAISATSVLGERLNTRGWGLAASLETGYPVALGAGWTLTPQLQAIYQTVGIDGGADRFGEVRYADTQSVHGRIGARLARDFAIEDGRKVTAWARVNYWHTFGGNGRATFANLSGGYPVALGAGLGGSWMQFGIGASGQITQNLSLFASGDYNLTVAQGAGQSYTGRVGLQMRW